MRKHASNPRPLPLWQLYPLFFAAVYLGHLTLLRLPYFWDEAGYYIPAAWDFYRTGSLIPQTTITNAHPPIPSILLAGWWHLYGLVPSGTRTLICLVAAAALLAVFRLTRHLLGTAAATAVTALTALYPIWYAQSTLAHADIFAAAFTLWALSSYLESVTENVSSPSEAQTAGARKPEFRASNSGAPRASETWTPTHLILTALLFSLAALSKETAIVTPAALALYEFIRTLRAHASARRDHLRRLAALAFPALPLIAWYAFHYHRTGFVFGNPEYLRYNASANLDAHRIALCLYHRALHLTGHMNMFVPVGCTLAALFMPRLAGRTRLPRHIWQILAVILMANWLAFSVLGGALLTRYLLPMYPLVLLLCVAEWQLHLRTRQWAGLALLSAAAFLAGIFVNPPYAFAPEDNLTYRDFIVLHQRAVNYIAQHYPQASVLTAWPAFSELNRPELGYTRTPIKAIPIQNFSLGEIESAAQPDNVAFGPSTYDTALLFSTKWSPRPGARALSRGNSPADAKYFDFHEDVSPAQAALILHGEVVWQAARRGEWVAVLRFPRVVDARLATP
jgi:4-amino-4-deoxy-L-arabinose transferase-like glycosyltransferase